MPRIERILPRRQGAWLELVSSAGRLRLPADKLPADAQAGAELSDARWAELMRLGEYETLLDRALRLLGRREHFVAELRQKLSQPVLTQRQRAEIQAAPEQASQLTQGRLPSRELVEQVLGVCRERGYLNDERAAEYLTVQLAQRGDIGKRRVREELLRRGCAAALADSVLEAHAGDFDERGAIEALLLKRRRSLEGRVVRLREKLQRQIDKQLEEDAEAQAHAKAEAEEREPTPVVDLQAEPQAENGEAAQKSRKPVKKPFAMKQRKDERWLRFELRGRMSAAVQQLLAARGFVGDEARRAGQRVVDELLGDSS